ASNTLFIYDFLLTFGQEVSLIWWSKWSIVKVLFLLSRYMPFVDIIVVTYHQFGTLSISQCNIAYQINGWMFVIGMALSEVILTIRTWIIWNKDKRLTYGLPVFFCLTWAAGFVVMSIFIRSLAFIQLPFPFIKGCIVIAGSRILTVDWALLMFYNTGNLMLMVIRVTSLYWSGVESRLLRRLYTDGVFYYAFLFGISVINVSVIFSLPPEYVDLLSSTQRALHSILSSRVILDIREQAADASKVQLPIARIHLSSGSNH
ncbi:hypothetical protein AX17_001588, partial [Amanita inopinata Kibby_2008]